MTLREDILRLSGTIINEELLEEGKLKKALAIAGVIASIGLGVLGGNIASKIRYDKAIDYTAAEASQKINDNLKDMEYSFSDWKNNFSTAYDKKTNTSIIKINLTRLTKVTKTEKNGVEVKKADYSKVKEQLKKISEALVLYTGNLKNKITTENKFLPQGTRLRVEYIYSPFKSEFDGLTESDKNNITDYTRYEFGYDTEVVFKEN